jgi:photosystem II stability/assembly factor-like uncharacterized protein
MIILKMNKVDYLISQLTIMKTKLSIALLGTCKDEKFAFHKSIALKSLCSGLLLFFLCFIFNQDLLAQTWKPLLEPGVGGWSSGIGISPHSSNKIVVCGDVLGLSVTNDGGKTWLQTSGFTTWEMSAPTFHPTNKKIIWVGSMSGPYKSMDAGITWVSRRNGMPPVSGIDYSCPIEKVLYNPANPKVLLAFGGSNHGYNGTYNNPNDPTKWGGVWRSINGGETWKEFSQIGQNSFTGISSAAYAGNSTEILYAAAERQGIFKSKDGGKTWVSINNGIIGGSVWNVVSHPIDPLIVYAGVSRYLDSSGTWKAGGIYKTIDGGNNWTKLAGGLDNNDDVEYKTASYKAIDISKKNPNVLYASNYSYWPTGVFKSTDGGDNWERVVTNNSPNTPTRPRGIHSGLGMTTIDTDDRDENHVVCVNSDAVYETKDGGKTWKGIVNDLVDNDKIKGRGYSGWVTTNFKFNPLDSNVAVFQAMDNGKFWVSRDKLITWKGLGENMTDNFGGRDVTFAGPEGKIIYMTAGQNGYFEAVYKSIDGGDVWERMDIEKFLGITKYGGTPTGIYALPENPDVVWVVAQDKLYKSTDGGISWKKIFEAIGLRYIKGEPNNSQTFYVTSKLGLYKTVNGDDFTLMEDSPTNIERIDVAGSDYILVTCWRTDDGISSGLHKYDGQSWAHIKPHYLLSGVAIDPTNRNNIAVSYNQHPYTDTPLTNGVDVSTDGGLTWISKNDGLSMLRGEVLAFNPHVAGELIFGTLGRGFFRTNLSTITGSNLNPTTISQSSITKPLANEESDVLNVIISPNPTSDNINISFNNQQLKNKVVVVSIVSMEGEVIKSVEGLISNDGSVVVNLSDVQIGMYVLFVEETGTNRLLARERFIKQMGR